MGKYIVVAAVLVLLFWMLRASWRRAISRRRDKQDASGGERLTDDMVRCVQCGVHLPRGESLMVCGEVFCSTEHERQFTGRGKG